jgi:hypothetical protein
VFETELQIEMSRYIELTKSWTGFKKYKILCAWMGTIRMREMNDFLAKQLAEEEVPFKGKEVPPTEPTEQPMSTKE